MILRPKVRSERVFWPAFFRGGNDNTLALKFTFGRHYLSNTTCLIQPRLLSTTLIPCLIQLITIAELFATFEDNLR